MRHTITLIVLVLFTILVAGCSSKPSDSQYTYFQQGNVPTIAESSVGYYFTMGMYIYYMDKDNMAPVVLCNQAACLHDKEANPRLVSNCQAFVGRNNGLFYCNDNIYVVTSTSSTYDNNNKLLEISLDGTTRKTICSFNGIVTGATALHQGYLYYAYSTWDGEQNSIYGVNRINLNSIFPKDSVVYQGNTLGGTVNDIMAYQDNIYFIDFSHVINPPMEQYYRYNLTSGETQLLYGLPEDVITSSPAIMNNKLHYRLNHLNPLATVDQKHCVAELDGTNSVDSFIINTNAQLHSDGMFFYEFSTAWSDNPPPPEKQMLRILNEEGKECNSVNIGTLDVNRRFIAGGKQHLFIKTENGETLNLYYLDKDFKTETLEMKLALSVKRSDCFKETVL